MDLNQATRPRQWFGWTFKIFTLLLVLTTFVPIFAADAWWIRWFDFPRLQITIMLGFCAIWLIFLDLNHRLFWASAIFVALVFQSFKLLPLMNFVPSQAVWTSQCQQANIVTLMSVNVLQSNDQHSLLLKAVESADPDILLLMETGHKWLREVMSLSSRYPYSQTIPLNNFYGMALYSKLPLKDLTVRYLVQNKVPSIHSKVILPNDKIVNLYTIHPKPPHPGRDSGQRDAELILLARDVKVSGKPTIIMGDFNDVSWSTSMELFHKIGSTIDPRRGNGFFATFDAKNPLTRWPLDHIFFTDDFGLMDLDTGGDIGSDHFPLMVRLCLNSPRFSPLSSAEKPNDGDFEDAAEQLRKGTGKDVQSEANKLENQSR